MRQRNDTGYPLLVAADPPYEVADRETVDLPEPVAGLTQLDRPEDAPGKYDPADHTVEEVLDHLARANVDQAEAKRIFAVEAKGEKRSTLLEHRTAVLAAKANPEIPQEQQ
jgi:hypothetical protein